MGEGGCMCMVWYRYDLAGFNVPLDKLSVISETTLRATANSVVALKVNG